MKCYCDECVFNYNRNCVNDEDDIWITDGGECALCAVAEDYYTEVEPLKEGEENEK